MGFCHVNRWREKNVSRMCVSVGGGAEVRIYEKKDCPFGTFRAVYYGAYLKLCNACG